MTAAARAWEAEADVSDAASTPFSCKPRSWGQYRYYITTRGGTGVTGGGHLSCNHAGHDPNVSSQRVRRHARESTVAPSVCA